jgi:hypothetical protein
MVGPMTMTKVPKTRADSKYNDQPGTGRTGMYRIPPNNYDFYTEDEKCVRRRPSRATRPRTSSARRASRARAVARLAPPPRRGPVFRDAFRRSRRRRVAAGASSGTSRLFDFLPSSRRRLVGFFF